MIFSRDWGHFNQIFSVFTYCNSHPWQLGADMNGSLIWCNIQVTESIKNRIPWESLSVISELDSVPNASLYLGAEMKSCESFGAHLWLWITAAETLMQKVCWSDQKSCRSVKAFLQWILITSIGEIFPNFQCGNR